MKFPYDQILEKIYTLLLKSNQLAAGSICSVELDVLVLDKSLEMSLIFELSLAFP